MKKKESSSYSLLILFVIWMATFAGTYQQFQLPPLAERLFLTLNITNTQFSSMMSGPMIPAILFSILAGVLADRYGVKRVVGVGMFMGFTALILRIFAVNFWQFFFCMVFSGFGSAFLNANLPKIVATWFSVDKINKMMGICMTASSLAMTIGMGTTALFPTTRVAFTLAALLSGVVFIIWLIFMRNKPHDNVEQPAQPLNVYLKVIIKNKAVWLVGFCLMFLLGCNMIISSFLPTALIKMRGIDSVTAGTVGAMFVLGTFFGSILGPLLFHRIGRIGPFIMGIGMVGAVLSTFAWLVPNGISLYAALLFAGCPIGAAIPILMAFPISLPEIGPTYAGSAGGIISTLQLLGAVMIPTFIATPIAGDNYYLLFGMAGACMLIMGLIALFLPKHKSNNNQ